MPDGFSFPQISQTAIPLPPPGAQDEANLIRVCRDFAEAEFAIWYGSVLASERDAGPHEECDIDWSTVRWIEATPATTLDGLRAKALAYSAWNRDAFDDPEDDRDGMSPMLASLLRDLARQDRDAIIARLAERYGPLPEGYTANGMWLGKLKEVEPEPPVRESIVGPNGSVHTMDLHGRGSDGSLYLWSAAKQVEAITRFPMSGPWIEGGHYLIEDAGEAVTVHCSNLADGRVSVQFMCSRRETYMTQREAERLLCGRVVRDPKVEAETLGLLTGLQDIVVARQMAPSRKRGAA